MAFVATLTYELDPSTAPDARKLLRAELCGRRWQDRHEGRLNAVFADGHVAKVERADITLNGDLWCRTDN